MTGKASSNSGKDENRWVRSSYSASGTACVEAKFNDGLILVRDSKDKRARQPVLTIAAPEWRSFLATVTDQKAR